MYNHTIDLWKRFKGVIYHSARKELAEDLKVLSSSSWS